MPQTVLAILNRVETAHPVLAASSLVTSHLRDACVEALRICPDLATCALPDAGATAERLEMLIGSDANRQHLTDLTEIYNAWQREAEDLVQLDEREIAGATASIVAVEGRKADLIVIGRTPPTYVEPAMDAIRAGLFGARRPVLLVPEAVPSSLGRSPAVLWKNGSATERVIDAALPVLLRAERVTVAVESKTPYPGTGLQRLLHRLELEDIPTEIHHFERDGQTLGKAAIARAHHKGSDLVVMGTDTQSELRDFFLDEGTGDCPCDRGLPILMRH
jgi:nucleotide-binding universal stress UspA family protein